jgi:hypothetical protein
LKLLRKIGDFALRAVALCLLVAFSVLPAFVAGALAILVVGFFREMLASCK